MDKKQKRGFKGIWIPSEIWLNPDLSIMEKLFIVEINSLDNKKGCYASNAYFADFFQISKARCTQILKGLEEKKYITIEIKYKGNQITKRVLSLSEGVVNFLNRGGKFSKQGSKFSQRIYNNLVKDKSFTNKETSKDVSLSPYLKATTPKQIKQKEDKPYLKLATKLSKIIQTKKDIKHSLHQLRAWSVDIKKLTTQNNIPKKRIKEVLNWYSDNIGGEYIPVVESGSSLYSKFDKLENAIAREKTNKTKKNAPSIGYQRKDGHKYKKEPDKIL